MIPILDLKKQIAPIRQELDIAIKKVIDDAHFVFGKEISDFEDAVTEYTQAKYAVGVSNGTDAIKLVLIALGIKCGDGVICPAFTYYATCGAVASIGARPVFCDIDPDTYNISSSSVEKVLKNKRKLKIKAIIPVHLYGQCTDMEAILEIARIHKLKVIEDTAQAFGAEYKGRKAGTMGDCGAVSFFPGKNLGAFGDAGMVLTNSKTIAEKLRILRNQGNKDKYYHLVLGYNHRLDTIQAAVLGVKLKYLDSWNRKRQEIAAYYNQGLKGLEIKTPAVREFTTHIYHQYVLRLNSPSKKLIEHLKNKEIDARVYYPVPLHLQKCFKYLGYKKGDFPESEKASLETLAIPIYPDLAKEEIEHIIESIRGFIR
jgi:dTDP-4-amino-4,6-dideoxygalactose transaminase